MMVQRKFDAFEQSPSMSRRGDMAAFDVWLARELKRSYEQTLAEPLPADLLALLEPGPDRG